MTRQVLPALVVSLFVALGGLAGCGAVDESVEGWCAADPHCECDEGGECCITRAGLCYDGQCCDGLVCDASGRCIPE